MVKQNRKTFRESSKAQHPRNAQDQVKKEAPRSIPSTTLDSYLVQRTGWSSDFWFKWIGERIAYHSKPVDGSVHSESDVLAWVKDLAQYIFTTIYPMKIYDWSKMDGNIIVSSLLGLILTSWSVRIVRAKSYDGRRPVDVRRMMMQSLNFLHHAILDSIVNESCDHIYFPSQGWDPPFSPDAQDGAYV